jgi:hypothetical protein
MCKTCGKTPENNRGKVCVLTIFSISLHPPVGILIQQVANTLSKSSRNAKQPRGSGTL